MDKAPHDDILYNDVCAAIRAKGGWAVEHRDVVFTYTAAIELASCPWRCFVYRRISGTSIGVYGEAFADVYLGKNDIVHAFGLAAEQFSKAWEYWALLFNWSA